MGSNTLQILLVEDNPGDARLLRETLRDVEGLPHEVTHVERLDEAIQHLGKRTFDVLLLDLSLPDSQGTDTVRRILAVSPHLPVVVLTGTDDDAVSTEAVRCGAQDYLVKGQTDHRLLMRSIRYAVERKRAEEELQKLVSVVRQSREFINIATPDGMMVYLNDAGAELLGLDQADVPRTHILQALPEALHGKVQGEILPALRSRGFWEGELQYRNLKTGRLSDVFATTTAIKDPVQGTLLYLANTSFDITERKRAEEALRQSEERYRTAFSSMSEGFCIIEVVFNANARPIDYRFLEINPAFEAQTGLHDAQGKLMRDLAPDHEAHWFEIYGEVALTGRPAHFVNEAKALGRWYEVSAYRVGGADGRKVAILFNDITERQHAEEALRAAKVSAEQAKGVAEAASKAKDQFIAVLSHELRTPLTPALAAVASLADDDRLPADVRDDLAMVRRNVSLEVRLIADLLDVSRIISGKMHLEKRPVDVAGVLREAAAIVSGDLDAKGQTLLLETHGAPYLAFGDAARLQQVFWNLLRNAIKFSPERGRIVVRAALVPGDHCPLAAQPCPVGLGDCPLPPASHAHGPCKGNLVIEVIDQGCGIAPAMLPRLFNAFEQDAQARSFGGLGLGLSICKAVVEMHGGTVAAHSAGAGCGATFTVQLPVAQCRLTPRGSGDGAATTSSPAMPSPPPKSRRPRRVLLVEDHGDTAKVMQRMLAAAGHDVIVAGSVAAGLEAVKRQVPDVLISDMGLPDGTGLELLAQLRAEGQRFPAIALSGYGMPADIARSREAGFAEHLVKPLSAIDLLFDALARQGIGNGPGARGRQKA